MALAETSRKVPHSAGWFPVGPDLARLQLGLEVEVIQQVWPREPAGPARQRQTPQHCKQPGAGGRGQRARTRAMPPLSLRFWVLVHTHPLCVCVVRCV